MPALASDLRKTLENTVVKARDKAEGGARDALTALAVGASEPFASMSEEERKLRNRLRARGRQLGDQRDAQKGTQSIERLVREMAYEHWHRMLFARFLAENQLLIEPTSGVAISLDECEELAAEESTDLWGLAAQFAQSMLPQIFRVDDPVLAAKLPLEIRQHLQGLVAGLETETFTASDSLGWTYQFWQTKRKKEVNDSGVKIGADEISPVTQLFTEDYMVDFLLDNTLGAWHAGKVLAANPQLASTAQSEVLLRQAVGLPGCPWSYLRFIKTDDGSWAPAAGTFDGWPKTAAELKCLDPCMGSGHFVVAMFERLVALRMEEEGLNEKAAVATVIEANVFGLEIDPRCSQIGAFNLALAAWRHVGYHKLPVMNVACSGLVPYASLSEWLTLSGDNERLRNGMDRLYQLFSKASVLGSLINPRSQEADLLQAGFQELQPFLEQALACEPNDDAAYELAVTARGLSKAAEILTSRFALVATNPPFLSLERQSSQLEEYIKDFHSEARRELSLCLFDRFLQQLLPGGNVAFVLPGEWTFTRSNREYRRQLLKVADLCTFATIGPDAFATPIRATPVLIVASLTGENATGQVSCFDCGTCSLLNKSAALKEGVVIVLNQEDWEREADSRLLIQLPTGDTGDISRIGDIADCRNGIVTGDGARFQAFFWEVQDFGDTWEALQGSTSSTKQFGGRELIIRWEKESGQLAELAESVRHLNHSAQNWRRGKPLWGRRGIIVNQIGAGTTIYSGDRYDGSCFAIVPNDDADLPALAAFALEGILKDELQKINPTWNLKSPKTLLQLPIDLRSWRLKAHQVFEGGFPEPSSGDATQWIFGGRPSDADQSLHVAVPRLLGYRWPRQSGLSYLDCPEISPDGLEDYCDDDGIVCLSAIRGEASASDRLRSLLTASFAGEWNGSKERELLLEAALLNDGKKAASNLDDWLRRCFFAEHCKIFHGRPFVWHIWDGNINGFNALVNYHKLAGAGGQGRKTLELLTFTYLGDWIDRQRLDQAEGVNGADDRLTAALDLQRQLKNILHGEPPYDLFIRWKPIYEQPIGWEPDVNDGVRVNIRPFLFSTLRKNEKREVGILRWKPGSIHWKKDRGGELNRTKEDFPWFWGWEENDHTLATDFGAPISGSVPAGESFDGNRWNDLHYTRAAKEAARSRHRGEG